MQILNGSKSKIHSGGSEYVWWPLMVDISGQALVYPDQVECEAEKWDPKTGHLHVCWLQKGHSGRHNCDCSLSF